MAWLLDPYTFQRQSITPFVSDDDQPGIASLPKSTAAGTATGQTARAPATPTTKAAFDTLPSGSLYVNPGDGKIYREN